MTEGIDYSRARGPDGIVIYAMGDIHGRLDLLDAMHARIVADIEARQTPDWRIIHLGDLIDRGPQSRQVIDRLIDATTADPRHIVLAGNHDLGLLDFLREPEPTALFARYGGVETALSYGVRLDFETINGFARSARALAAAVGESHMRFLEARPLAITFGDFFFCHAGIRPGVPLADQEPNDLVWIREAFLGHTGLHPKVIVHGHTPGRQPEVLVNRVNVDTLAYASGLLSALVIDGADKQILQIAGSVG